MVAKAALLPFPKSHRLIGKPGRAAGVYFTETTRACFMDWTRRTRGCEGLAYRKPEFAIMKHDPASLDERARSAAMEPVLIFIVMAGLSAIAALVVLSTSLRLD